jgi:biopolymer transport protein TolQ
VALSQRRIAIVSEGCLRTLGRLFALQLQAQGGPGIESPSGSGFIGLVANSTPVSKFVLLILGLLSIASWSIFLYKWWIFRRSARQSAQFVDIFRRSNKFSEVQAVCRSLADSPLVGLFQSGYAELTAQLRQSSPEVANGPNPRPAPPRPTLKSLPAVDRALLRASVVEVNKLEQSISWLATTASIAPFIGLFGTVWGIIIAFQKISQSGSTNLQAVGPGISEALIATAAGLFAAIPAVLFYNLLTQRTKIFASEMDDFSMEFLNIAERNFT